MKTMKTVLVTGGSGWIGGYVIDRLLQMGYKVHATYRTSPRKGVACTWHSIDLFDYKKMQALIKQLQPSHLMHLAWEAVPPQCYFSLRNYHWTWSSIELIQQFVHCGGTRAVITGSCAEYEWITGYLTENSSALSSKTLYAVCKNSLHTWLQAYAKQIGLSNGWARIFHLYGPYDTGNRLVSSTIRSLLTGEKALCSHGKQFRDYLYIKDVADALVSLLMSDVQGAMNIGSGHPVQVKELISIIAQNIEGEHQIHLGAHAFPKNEPLFVGANIDRLRRELNWSPQYSLEEGLKETIEWWKQR